MKATKHIVFNDKNIAVVQIIMGVNWLLYWIFLGESDNDENEIRTNEYDVIKYNI